MTVDDRVYHGVQAEPSDRTPNQPFATITVERSQYDGHDALYELRAADEFGDHLAWGYHGDGPQRATAALLCDALALDDPPAVGMAVGDNRFHGSCCAMSSSPTSSKTPATSGA